MAKPKIKKEFKLTSLAVDNRISVYILGLIIVLLGLSSYQSTPKESFPDIKQPIVFVSTIHPGNAPEDIDNLITRHLEQEINSIAGVENITSISVQDYSGITIEFDVKEDITKAMQDVRDAVDRAKPDLPSDLDTDPSIIEFDVSDFPVMFINLYGDVGEDMLKDNAEYLQDEIEKLEQIKDVDLAGIRNKVVNILVDEIKMQAANVTLFDIQTAINDENVTMSAGDVIIDEFSRNLRIVGEFTDPEQIKNVVIKSNGGGELKLGSIAEVNLEFGSRDSYAKMNGQHVVTLNVKKRTGENLIIAAKQIQKIISDAKAHHKIDPKVTVEITGDHSKYTEDMIKDLESNIISGIILVVGVLMFFLGLRNAVFVGIAIPLSMLTGIFLISTSGNTLNMMVLFSLILALGMLVDNGIVVVENVYRLMKEGYTRFEAAKKGVGEIAMPIIASTATTLAAFTPMLFWGGIMGEFMKFLPITLILVLGSSLMVALIINPVLTATLMKIQDDSQPQTKQKKQKWVKIALILIGIAIALHILLLFSDIMFFRILRGALVIISFNIFVFMYYVNPVGRWFRTRFMPYLEKRYQQVLRFVLNGKNPHIVLGATVFLLFASIIFFGSSAPKVIFFPENEATYVNTFIELPMGTDIEATRKYTANLEKRVYAAINPYENIVESVQTQIGRDTGDPAEGSSVNATPHKARITVNFVEFKLRGGQSTNEVLEKIRSAVEGVPGAIITASKNSDGPPVGKPINIEIIGENYEQLVSLSKELRHELEALNIPGIEGLKTNLEEGKPEALVQIDRAAARRNGLSSAQIAYTLRTALFGQEISTFKEDDEDYEIWLRLRDKDRYNLNSLLNLKLPNNEEFMVPLSAVADIKYSSSYGSVRRKNLDKVITIFSNVKEGYNPTEINAELREYLSNRQLPDGYSFKFSGEQEEQAKTMNFLMKALGMALLLIFLILVTQFNSVIMPAIIGASVLFSTIGVFIGLAITGMDFVILMMMVGLISLAGIVVNNAIVLIDYTNLIRRRTKRELSKSELNFDEIKDVIVAGGKTRLRPVLLTAITTILGLIPLAVGLNINFVTLVTELNPHIFFGGDNVAFWSPMAWTIIFGLAFATFLTLIVVPIMYYLNDWFIRNVFRKFINLKALNN